MASRMERYQKEELVNSGRSTRNQNLYKQIENLESYTNIEGVATIDKTNEIDITKVQELLRNRENYKKQKKVDSLLASKEEEKEVKKEVSEEEKNYDINDILLKVKQKQDNNTKCRSLDEEDYKALKNVGKKESNYNIEKEEDELKELINTFVINKKSEDLTGDVGLLDSLKSDTMVGDVASIKKILEEEKKVGLQENTMELDKSFYTSSFGFTQKDFEELKDINHGIKKSNKFIIVLLVMLILLVIICGIFFMFM